MRLRFPHTSVAACVPGVSGITDRGVLRFDPPPLPLIGELNHGDRTQPIRNRELVHLPIVTAAVFCEVVPARPGAARAECMERRQPGQFRQGDIGLAMFPRRARLVREVAQIPAVRRQIGSPREDATAKPGPRLVTPCSKIPSPNMRPITRPPTKHRYNGGLYRWNTIDTRSGLPHHDRPSSYNNCSHNCGIRERCRPSAISGLKTEDMLAHL